MMPRNVKEDVPGNNDVTGKNVGSKKKSDPAVQGHSLLNQPRQIVFSQTRSVSHLR
jgi:hypothetical protein